MRFGTSPTALNASASNCWRTGRWTSRVPRTSRPYAYCVVMLVHDGTNAVARSAECGARGDNSRGQEKRPADGLASEMAGDGPERPYGARSSLAPRPSGLPVVLEAVVATDRDGSRLDCCVPVRAQKARVQACLLASFGLCRSSYRADPTPASSPAG